MIKLVTFDLDGVFFHRPHEDFAERYAKRFGLDIEFVKDVLFNRSEIEGGYRDLKLGKQSDYFNWEFKTLGIEGKITIEERMEILLDGYSINNEVLSFIKDLREKGRLTASVTNRYRVNTEYLEKKFHFKQYFDILVLSHEVGILKPDKEIFQILIDRSGLKPKEIIYSDDDEKKVLGARELGINTYIFKNFNQFKQDIEELIK